MRSTNLVILWTALVLILASNVEAGHEERLIRRLMKTNRKLINHEIGKHDNIAKFVGGGFNEHRFCCDPTTHWPDFKDNNKIAGRDFDHGDEDPKDFCLSHGHRTRPPPCNPSLGHDEPPK